MRVLGGSLGPAPQPAALETRFLRRKHTLGHCLLAPLQQTLTQLSSRPPWMGRKAPTQVGDTGCFLGAPDQPEEGNIQAQTCSPAPPAAH